MKFIIAFTVALIIKAHYYFEVIIFIEEIE
jgi:hypothetical protein